MYDALTCLPLSSIQAVFFFLLFVVECTGARCFLLESHAARILNGTNDEMLDR